MIRRCILATVIVLTAGCAQMRANLGENDQARQFASLIGYVQNVAAMRPELQRRELSDATQMYTQNHTPYARVRLAMLLSLPGTGFPDYSRAAALLEPLAASAADGPGADAFRQFAGWFHAQLAERMREHRRTVQLKEQLDALRAIERTLIDRSEGHAR